MLPLPSLEPPAKPEKPVSARREMMANKPVRRWHEAIIDDLLAFPRDTMANRATRLGYNVDYLRVITNSDMFKAAYAARREQYSMVLNHALAEKIGGVAELGLDILKEQLTSKRTTLPFAAVAETTLSVLDKLGFGPQKGQNGVQVTVNTGNATPVISAERLAGARQRLRDSENAKLVEAEVLPSPREAPVSYRPEPEEG